MALLERLYPAAVRLARALSPLAARGDSKLARGVRGRRGAALRLEAWAARERDPARPLAWFHAPSVGEGLQARAVLEALRAERPDLQLIFTHFSPSAEALSGRMPVDATDYLPWDLPAETTGLLERLSPDLVVFTKTEVWPVLSRCCSDRGVPTALVAATLAPGSSRERWWARALLGPAYGRLSSVLAVGSDDGVRLRRLGVPPGALLVTGDPGVDAAVARARTADPAAPYLAPLLATPAPTVVAGSTWPADEAMLVPALTRVRLVVPDLRLVVAPHEPDRRHVPPLLAALESAGWPTATLAAVEKAGTLGEARAVVVDRVGVLAHLYTAGSVAYVGGGFGSDGLHSVLEPAAAGLAVAFGPRHANARAAAELVELGGARTVRGAGDLANVVEEWLTSPDLRASVGGAGRGYIESHLGAARRSAEALAALLPPRSRSRPRSP
jgi:3-deoxy-D-manno-octulosonic-acid transferase